jgi:nucleoside-diphosphate-sugar epimerase
VKTKEILITGASGFLGRSLTEHLLAKRPDARLVLADVRTPACMSDAPANVRFVKADLGDVSLCDSLVTPDTGVIYHFAALVSGGAEQHFEVGFRVNMIGMINMLESSRRAGHRPRFVFTSTMATFGGSHMGDEVDDFTPQHPQSSYGAAKVAGEQLLNDYSRRGFVDGRGVRLPAIVVRDDPHAGLSCASSAMVRESIAGRNYTCPLPPETCMPILSASRCMGMLALLAELPQDAMGDYCVMNAPSISPTFGEIAQTVSGCGVRPLGRITFDPDPAAVAIVSSWPKVMRYGRAARLGFSADQSLQEIVSNYVRAQGT